MTRLDALAHLVAERQRLTALGLQLRREFGALRHERYPREKWAAYRCSVNDFHHLLKNHAIALEWTLHQPSDRCDSYQRSERDKPRAALPSMSLRRHVRCTSRGRSRAVAAEPAAAAIGPCQALKPPSHLRAKGAAVARCNRW